MSKTEPHKIVAGLNEAICYARGWNAAVQEAAKIADKLRPHSDADIGHAAGAIADEIRTLDRSMQATND